MRIMLLGRAWNLSFVRLRGIKGDCSPPDRPRKRIRIHGPLRGKLFLDTLIHEMLHAADWSKDEEWVNQIATDMAEVIMRPEIQSRIIGGD